MKTKFLVLFAAACALFAAGCSDDKKSNEGDGPAGSSQQLAGSWNLSKIQMTVSGKFVEVSASDAGMTFFWSFSSDGTWYATTSEVDFPGSGGWSYNSGSRSLTVTEPGYTYHFYVKSLTDSEFAVRLDGMDWDLESAPVMVFGRTSRSAQSAAAPAAAAASDAALRTALSAIVNRSVKTNR